MKKNKCISRILHCVKAKIQWQLRFSLFGKMWALPSLVREPLKLASVVRKNWRYAWKATHLRLSLNTWKERNQRSFESRTNRSIA